MVPKLISPSLSPGFWGRVEKPYAVAGIAVGVGAQTQVPVAASGMMDFLCYRAAFESLQTKTLGYARECLENAGRLALENAGPTIWSGLTLGAAWYVSKKIPTLCQWVAKALPFAQEDESEIAKKIEPYAKSGLAFVTASLVLQYWGIDIARFLLGLGVFSTAVGLALRDQISNILGGMFIKSGERFKIGDLIQVDTKFGKVTKIGLTVTTLEGVDDCGNVVDIKINNGQILNKEVTVKQVALDADFMATIHDGDKFYCGEIHGRITGKNDYCFFYAKLDKDNKPAGSGILRKTLLNPWFYQRVPSGLITVN